MMEEKEFRAKVKLTQLQRSFGSEDLEHSEDAIDSAVLKAAMVESEGLISIEELLGDRLLEE